MDISPKNIKSLKTVIQDIEYLNGVVEYLSTTPEVGILVSDFSEDDCGLKLAIDDERSSIRTQHFSRSLIECARTQLATKHAEMQALTE